MGAYISIIGAIITISLNIYWIPQATENYIHGYMGSAWATFYCYGSMMILSLLIGRKYYPIPYNVGRILMYLLISVGIYFLSLQIPVEDLAIKLSINTLLLLAYLAFIYFMERKNIRNLS